MSSAIELISVVVPVYNVAQYLPRCIDSLLKQTYSNIEIIIVNDGSTDTSLDICKKYASLDKRIKIITQGNQGLSVARNTGIKNAQGNYLMLVDSDDYVSPSFCADAVGNQRRYHSDVVIFGYARVTGGQEYQRLIADKQAGELSKEEAMDYSVENSYAWNKLYRKSLFDDIEYPKGRYYEDGFTTYKLFAQAKVISYIPNVNYFYVENGNSIVASKSSKIIADQFEAIANQFDFLHENYPRVFANNINELIIKALRYCTFCPKSYNRGLYKRAYRVLKDNPIPKNIEKRYKVTMGLFKFSAPLALWIFGIQRRRKQ